MKNLFLIALLLPSLLFASPKCESFFNERSEELGIGTYSVLRPDINRSDKSVKGEKIQKWLGPAKKGGRKDKGPSAALYLNETDSVYRVTQKFDPSKNNGAKSKLLFEFSYGCEELLEVKSLTGGVQNEINLKSCSSIEKYYPETSAERLKYLTRVCEKYFPAKKVERKSKEVRTSNKTSGSTQVD